MPSQRMKMPRRVACRHYIVPMRQQECNEDIDLLHRKPTKEVTGMTAILIILIALMILLLGDEEK